MPSCIDSSTHPTPRTTWYRAAGTSRPFRRLQPTATTATQLRSCWSIQSRGRVSERGNPFGSDSNPFSALGAVQWAERARQELRAAGEPSGKREREAWDQLSPQEMQVAAMAAEGLSNREIGRKLYLSHRTV